MQKTIRSTLAALLIGGTLLGTGCAYGGIATTADNKVVVTRNDLFLFGLLRKVFVCDVTPAGLASCSEGEAP